MNTPPRKGDRVRVDHPKHPGVWTVDRVDPVNVVLRPEGGVGRLLRCPPSLLRDPDAPIVTAVDATIYNVGELVRIVSGRFAGLYVVIRDGGADKVNVAKLGGNGGAYVRALRGSISKVNPAEVLRNDYQEVGVDHGAGAR